MHKSHMPSSMQQRTMHACNSLQNVCSLSFSTPLPEDVGRLLMASIVHRPRRSRRAEDAPRLKIGPWLLHRPGRSRRATDAQRLKSGPWPKRRGYIHPECCTALCLTTHRDILQGMCLHANTSACNQASEHDPSKHARVLRVLAGG